MKIGAITIGQAPRTDVTSDIMDIFNGKVELMQRGGLDGLTVEQISAFQPQEGDYVLVSRLLDGTSVTFAERYILPRLQEAIHELEEAGARLIVFFCTGKFPASLTAKVPLIYPCDILDRVVPLLTKTSHIITVTPSPLQVEQCQEKWGQYVEKVTTIPASPYGPMADLEAAARQVKDLDGDLVVLDCIGFTQEMKELFARESGKLVVLPRTLLARVVSELTDVAQ
ncbi:AroM family protein [Dysosmobacter sp.]|uniref:AroM family protein n=1 Tax=Dysosmobacter sp. TaxID=2591382 RepID=UPI002A99C0C9|nr:AroM family protein [Dysosmobacter sp.]MCI6055002.1 AroM family protein [Dysosmobacter sp.]MDY5509117.1 AroM family protein [Dysosmobacter sp.]